METQAKLLDNHSIKKREALVDIEQYMLDVYAVCDTACVTQRVSACLCCSVLPKVQFSLSGIAATLRATLPKG